MTIVRRHHGRDQIGPELLTPSLRNGRYCFEPFMVEPLAWKKGALYVAPGGTSLQEQLFFTGRNTFEYAFLGDATDAFVPTLASEGGYNWVLTTATLDRGVEIGFGGTALAHPRNFIASSEDWFARILINVDDWSGVDIVFGFKTVAVPVLTLTEITDIVGLRVLGDSSSALAAFSAVTNLNNAGATDYSSTALTGDITDGNTVELEARSVGAKAHLYVNGVRVGHGVSYTFDSGDTLAPVARLLQTTDLAAEIKTLRYEAGPLEDRYDGTLLSLPGADS